MSEQNTTISTVYKAKMPLKQGDKYYYPLTTHDQIILANGERWSGLQSGTVNSVNGVMPDENGEVTLETVSEGSSPTFVIVNADTIIANKIVGAVYM